MVKSLKSVAWIVLFKRNNRLMQKTIFGRTRRDAISQARVVFKIRDTTRVQAFRV